MAGKGAEAVKPDFVVIGAARCATTSLCRILRDHPAVFMSHPKEPHFFSRPDVFARGLEWYEALFDGACGMSVVGEGSTTYTKNSQFPNAAERLASSLEGHAPPQGIAGRGSLRRGNADNAGWESRCPLATSRSCAP